MFSNNINIIKGEGGLNTPQAGFDYVSGIVFKAATVPSGFSYSIPQEIFSLVGAQNLGIVGNFADETAATSKITISATGNAGDSVSIKVVEPSINGTYRTINLGTYTLTASDAAGTLNSLASNISTLINVNYASSLFTAGAATGASFSITAEVGLGTTINSTTPTIVNTGLVSVSAAAFAGGVNSARMEEWYQISEFFRQNPNGVLWVDYETSFGSYNCINTTQAASDNKINQFGIYNSGATTSTTMISDIGALNAIATTINTQYSPLVIAYAPNIISTSNLGTLINLRSYTYNYVSGLIGQDGNALGAFLSFMYGKTIPALGCLLGCESAAIVSQDIASVRNFNISNGTELETVALGNGQLYNTLFTTNFNLLSQLDAYGWIFCMKRPNITGSWFNDSHSAVSITSDYNYIERNRTINKVVRQSYISLVELINGNISLNADGTLTIESLATLKSSVVPNMNAMVTNGEISAYSINISPSQNVLTTGNINIVMTIVPIGIAREITLNLSYAAAI